MDHNLALGVYTGYLMYAAYTLTGQGHSVSHFLQLVSQKLMAGLIQRNRLKLPLGQVLYSWLLSVQGHSEVMPCISNFQQPHILKTASRGGSEICHSGTLVTHIYNVTLTLYSIWGYLGSLCTVSMASNSKRLPTEQWLKFGTYSGTLTCSIIYMGLCAAYTCSTFTLFIV